MAKVIFKQLFATLLIFVLVCLAVTVEAQPKNWQERLRKGEQTISNIDAKLNQIWRMTSELYIKRFGKKRHDKIVFYDLEKVCPLCNKEYKESEVQ